MKCPPVKGYGDIEVESFNDYYSRWPSALSAIPKSIVEDWIYRHWRDFNNHWIKLEPHKWTFQCLNFSNLEIRSIDHIGTWIPELDAEGVEFVSEAPRSKTRLARYMLSNGTFPVPILVAKNAGHVMHPRSAREPMKDPYQLIEGHSRLACLRGMINANHPALASQHQIWVATIPRATHGV
jgi:hypothetical protein